MNKFTFDPKTHSYYLEVNGEKKRMTGVTTILGVISKPFLIPWAANMAVDYIEKFFKENDEFKDETLAEVLTEARKAHSQKNIRSGLFYRSGAA